MPQFVRRMMLFVHEGVSLGLFQHGRLRICGRYLSGRWSFLFVYSFPWRISPCLYLLGMVQITLLRGSSRARRWFTPDSGSTWHLTITWYLPARINLRRYGLRNKVVIVTLKKLLQ